MRYTVLNFDQKISNIWNTVQIQINMNSVFLALVHQTTTEKDEKTICARTNRAHFNLFSRWNELCTLSLITTRGKHNNKII